MSAEPDRFILDSFALLAFLQGENGMARVKEILTSAQKGQCQALLSWINLGEILYIIEREQGQRKARETLARIQALPLELLEVTSQAVLDAAHIKANHRMSYADAFAVAGALHHKATLLTGDPEFEAVQALISVEWLPRK